MKILGEVSRDTYIVEIKKTEIEKIFDKYFDKLNYDLKVGSEINLGAGYDFRSDIKRVCQEMITTMKSFENAQTTLHNFAVMVSELSDDSKS